MTRTTKHGLSLIELMITIVMFTILLGVILYVFRVVLLTWSSQQARAGIDISLDRGIEEMTRDLREAKDISSSNDEIRFTIEENGADNDYIFYFYNAQDSYPVQFDQEYYDLRKAALSGGISGTFTYGSGRIIIWANLTEGEGVLPPTTSDLSFNGTITTIDLSVSTGEETRRVKTEVMPRNL